MCVQSQEIFKANFESPSEHSLSLLDRRTFLRGIPKWLYLAPCYVTITGQVSEAAVPLKSRAPSFSEVADVASFVVEKREHVDEERGDVHRVFHASDPNGYLRWLAKGGSNHTLGRTPPQGTYEARFGLSQAAH